MSVEIALSGNINIGQSLRTLVPENEFFTETYDIGQQYQILLKPFAVAFIDEAFHLGTVIFINTCHQFFYIRAREYKYLSRIGWTNLNIIIHGCDTPLFYHGGLANKQ